MGLRSARKKARLTVIQVSEALGVTDAAIYQWENGVTKPRSDKLVKLSELYGCPVDDLLKEETMEAKLAELKACDKIWITPAEAAPFLQCDPNYIRRCARDDPAKLGFQILTINSRIKINRKDFLRYLGETV